MHTFVNIKPGIQVMYLGPGYILGKVYIQCTAYTKMFYYLPVPEMHGPIESDIFWNVVTVYDMYIHFYPSI